MTAPYEMQSVEGRSASRVVAAEAEKPAAKIRALIFLCTAALAMLVTLVCFAAPAHAATASDIGSAATDEAVVVVTPVEGTDAPSMSLMAGTYNQKEAYKLLALVNSARKQAGCGNLTWDSSLEKAAKLRAQEIVVKFDHLRPNGQKYSTIIPSRPMGNTCGENIAFGQASASAVNNAWINSDGHRANMLNRNFTTFAASFYKADNGQTYWVELFGGGVADGKSEAAGNTGNSGTSGGNTGNGSGGTSGGNTGSGNGSSGTTTTPTTGFSDVSTGHWVYKEGYLTYVAKNGIISGSNGRFEPDKPITRAQVAVILYRAATGKTAANTNNNVKPNFTDTPRNQYYSAAVHWCNQMGIITGYKNGTFAPNANVTRQDLATMIGRYAAYRTNYSTTALSASASKFNALGGTAQVAPYAKPYVVWCTANDVMKGINGNIAPAQTATRAQMAKMITVVKRDLKK